MKRFRDIDPIIEHYATELGARLTKDRPGYPQQLRTFEERRIDWVENDIRKAIIIQPNFEATGVNTDLWNFINVAWREGGYSSVPLQWYKSLVTSKDFARIVNQIEKLLEESVRNLGNVRLEDLERP
ncbi:hypothetical protein HUK80_06245 [Flavobacterium sp. MAH-1]|uniref:Uncharacterized protein n=1 Tax=Flavobacterium agri TaxID=2743471 RepID=A0A7Y8Y0U7_9FLAO|nr:hypothetical protein [Flavobacterium agri]NUY80489.1 hypothetical protein [Flavobacterium agri]NYA70514.1 hypothetical protein [Flavobacterium agri]